VATTPQQTLALSALVAMESAHVPNNVTMEIPMKEMAALVLVLYRLTKIMRAMAAPTWHPMIATCVAMVREKAERELMPRQRSVTTIIIATEMAVVKGAGLSQNTRVRKAAELPMTLAQRLRSKQKYRIA